MAAFVAHERRHIGIEEDELFPAALAIFTADDWARLDAKVTDTEDPLFDPAVEARFDRLVDRLGLWERQDRAEPAWLSQGW